MHHKIAVWGHHRHDERGTPFPDVLWSTAASLASKYGLSATASALLVASDLFVNPLVGREF